MSSFLKTELDRSKCTLTLYQLDDRMSEMICCDMRKLSFSQQSAKKVTSVVSSYFGIDQKWDKKLLKCIFLDSTNLNLFEFNKTYSPNITLGVKVSGNVNVIYNKKPKTLYVPIYKPGKISVTSSSIIGRNTYKLDYDDINEARSDDYSVVSLFNCYSFSRMMEYNTELDFSRTLEKLSLTANL